jgi:hypothetical protein
MHSSSPPFVLHALSKKYQALQLLFKFKIVVIKHEEQTDNCEARRKCIVSGGKHLKVERTETGNYAKNCHLL